MAGMTATLRKAEKDVPLYVAGANAAVYSPSPLIANEPAEG